MACLEADGIQLKLAHKSILSDVYLKCETGQISGLLGRNGTGKSCLLHIIYGTLKTEDKAIRINGKFIKSPFQKPELIRYLPQYSFIPKSFKVKSIFKDFKLDFDVFITHFPEFKNTYSLPIGKLSGGQCRIIEVYSIIKSKTQFILLDEPFSHIMPMNINKIIQLLHAEKSWKGILLTDHQYRYVINISEQLYLLKEGKTHTVSSLEDLTRLGYIR